MYTTYEGLSEGESNPRSKAERCGLPGCTNLASVESRDEYWESSRAGEAAGFACDDPDDEEEAIVRAVAVVRAKYDRSVAARQ